MLGKHRTSLAAVVRVEALAAGPAPRLLSLPSAASTYSASALSAALSLAGTAAKAETSEAAMACASEAATVLTPVALVLART